MWRADEAIVCRARLGMPLIAATYNASGKFDVCEPGGLASNAWQFIADHTIIACPEGNTRRTSVWRRKTRHIGIMGNSRLLERISMQLDAPTATLIGGLTAGTIGILSAIVSHLNLRVQIQRAEREAERQRQHQILVSTLPKTLEAVEVVAAIMFKAQASGKVSDEQIDSLVRALIWLPERERERTTLAIRSMTDKTKGSGAEIREAHASLLDLAKRISTRN